jgi:hypothetical protein
VAGGRREPPSGDPPGRPRDLTLEELDESEIERAQIRFRNPHLLALGNDVLLTVNADGSLLLRRVVDGDERAVGLGSFGDTTIRQAVAIDGARFVLLRASNGSYAMTFVDAGAGAGSLIRQDAAVDGRPTFEIVRSMRRSAIGSGSRARTVRCQGPRSWGLRVMDGELIEAGTFPEIAA